MEEVSYNQSWNQNQPTDPTQIPGASQAPNTPPSGNNKFALIGLIALIVVVIGYILFLFFGPPPASTVPPANINQTLPPGAPPAVVQ